MNGSIGGYSEKQIRQFGACNDSIPVVGEGGSGVGNRTSESHKNSNASLSLAPSFSLSAAFTTKTIKTIVNRMWNGSRVRRRTRMLFSSLLFYLFVSFLFFFLLLLLKSCHNISEAKRNIRTHPQCRSAYFVFRLLCAVIIIILYIFFFK